MRTVLKAALVLPLIFLAACSDTTETADTGATTPGPDSFVYDLTFTPEAEALIKEGYSLGTYTTYFGAPTPEWVAKSEAGRYQLDYEHTTFAADARRVRMNGPRLDADKLSRITGSVQVLMNVRVIDAKRLHERGIHCKAKVLPLETVKATPPVIECGIATP